MSMPNDDQYDDDGLADPQPKPRDLRAQIDALNAENAQLKQQAERTATLEKENAVFKANLGNLSEAQQAAVVATAKEMSAEALRSQAELLGFVEPAQPAVPAADLEAFDRVSTTTAGGGAADEASYEAEILNANDEKEVLAVMARYNKTIATYD